MGIRGRVLAATAVVFCVVVAALAWTLFSPQRINPAPSSGESKQAPTTPPAPASPQADAKEAPSAAAIAEVFGPGNHITVRGKIVTPTGGVVSGASIRATMNRMRSDGRSDASGAYLLDNIRPRLTYLICIEAPGYCPSVAQLKMEEKDQFNVDFVLQPGIDVSGRAVDAANKPMPAMRLEAVVPRHTLGQSNERPVLPFARTSEDGTFTLKAVPEGEYTFKGSLRTETVGALVSSCAPPLVVVAGRDYSNVTIVFPAADGVIEGRVHDSAGNVLENVTITTGRDTPEGLRSTRTDAQGFFRLCLLQEDTYDLLFGAPDENGARTWLRNVPANTLNADCVLDQPGSISGRVIDAATGKPLSGFDLQVLKITTGDGAEMDKSCRGTVKPAPGAGAFKIDLIGCGTATLYCTAEGYGSILNDVVVESGMTTDGVVLALPVPATIEGRVTVDGAPPTRSRVTIEAARADAPDVVVASKRLAEGGEFAVSELPAGQYILRATCFVKSGSAALGRCVVVRTRQVALENGSTTRFDLDFSGTAACHGNVAIPAGYTKATLVILDAASDAAPSAGFPTPADNAAAWGTLHSPGDYVIQGLLPGTYRVIACCDGDASPRPQPRFAEQTITLRDGDNVQVDFAP